MRTCDSSACQTSHGGLVRREPDGERAQQWQRLASPTDRTAHTTHQNDPKTRRASLIFFLGGQAWAQRAAYHRHNKQRRQPLPEEGGSSKHQVSGGIAWEAEGMMLRDDKGGKFRPGRNAYSHHVQPLPTPAQVPLQLLAHPTTLTEPRPPPAMERNVVPAWRKQGASACLQFLLSPPRCPPYSAGLWCDPQGVRAGIDFSSTIPGRRPELRLGSSCCLSDIGDVKPVPALMPLGSLLRERDGQQRTISTQSAEDVGDQELGAPNNKEKVCVCLCACVYACAFSIVMICSLVIPPFLLSSIEGIE